MAQYSWIAEVKPGGHPHRNAHNAESCALEYPSPRDFGLKEVGIMGNRSYLYLSSRHGESDDNLEIAEANNNIPRLWHVLLAQGHAATPITDQRIFNDSGTDNIAADVTAAMARYRLLAAGLLEHPLIHKLPALPRYLRAVESYLEEQLKERQADPADLVFSANLDEYAWLDDLPPEEFILQQQAEFDETWQQLKAAIAQRNFPALETALGLSHPYGGFEDWQAWCWEVGLGGFSSYHAYFEGCDDAPREEEFADFTPPPDTWEAARANDLGLQRQRFVSTDRYGVERLDAQGHPDRVLLAPEWEQIWTADETPREELWVQREGQIGLACVPPEGEAQVLLAPCLEEAWYFAGNLAVVQKDGVMGMLQRDGSWFLKPALEDLWDYELGYAAARQNGLVGYLDTRGAWAIPPRFDSGGGFTPPGVAPVSLAGRHGLVRPDGSYAAPLEFEALEWDEDFDTWTIRQQNRLGLLHPDGSPWIDPAWDEIHNMLEEGHLFTVCQQHRWGLLDPTGKLRLPCQFDEIWPRPVPTQDAPSLDEQTFLVEQDGRQGLLDIHGNFLVPKVYAELDELSPHDRDHQQYWQPELILVRESQAQASAGVWNIHTASLLIPCRYEAIMPVYLGEGRQPIFLVGNPTPPEQADSQGDYAVGILNADGTPLFAQDYGWLGEDVSFSTPLGRETARDRLYQAWSKQQPVQAGLVATGEYVWLHADGTRQGQVEKLTADYRAGNLEAAHALALSYRDGKGVAANEALTRRWLTRAAGTPENPGLPEAMADLADLLATDDMKTHRVQARHWLELALSTNTQWDQAAAQNHLGSLYLNGVGGPFAPEKAFPLFVQAAQKGNTYAIFNRALCHENGWGTPQDLEQALLYFRQAEQRGMADAAYKVGLILEQAAAEQTGATRQQMLEETAYYHRRELARENGETRGEACHRLARLLLAGYVKAHQEDEVLCVLESGARAGHPGCHSQLLDCLEAPDSPYRHEERAAFWRAQQAEPVPEDVEPITESKPGRRRWRWLLQVLLLLLLFWVYRSSGA